MSRLEPYVKASETVKRTPNLPNLNGTSNIGLVMVSAVGPQLAYIQGPAHFLATYTIGNEIPRNADISFINAYYLSFSANLVIARAMNTTATSGLLFNKQQVPCPVLYKNGAILTNQTNITFEVENENRWSFVLNNTVFFKGNYSAISTNRDYKSFKFFIQCEDLADVAGTISNWPGYTAEFKSSSNELIIKHGKFVQLSTELPDKETEEHPGILNKDIIVNFPKNYFSYKLDEDGIEIEDENGNAILETHPMSTILIKEEDWLFSVYSKDAQASNMFEAGVELIKNEEHNFELKFKYPGVKGDETQVFVVSLNPEATDISKASSYIDNLNVMPNWKFGIEIFTSGLNEDGATLFPFESPSKPFGDSGLDLNASKKPSNLKLALTELGDQERFDIEYLAPVGITNLSFIKMFTQLGRTRDWFTPIDIPIDRTNPNSIRMYMNEVDKDSNVYCCGPFDKNSGLTGWINLIACSTLYYEKLMRNRAMGAEFAPLFDKEFGTLQMVNPVFQLGKSDREELLSFGSPVNFIKYDQRLDLFYMNNNLTHQDVNDVISEEQNRRLVNKIKKEVNRIMEVFKGSQNTKSTRSRVIGLITYFFKNSIMNKQFPPHSFNIICDESNNPNELIDDNRLALVVEVKLYKSIKFIEVVNNVYSISSEFSQS